MTPELKRDVAERKAIESLARYKFLMFGYWAGVWVHMNRLCAKRKPSPFKPIVRAAREILNRKPTTEPAPLFEEVAS